MGRITGFILFYVLAIPMVGFGAVLGAYGAYLDYLDAQERFSVLGLDSIYWALALVLVGCVAGNVKLLLENHRLRQSPLSTEELQHHRDIIDFLKTLNAVDLLTHSVGEISNWVRQKRDNWPIPGGKAWIVESNQIEVRISIEQRPQWLLAKEHLKGERLWNLVETWKKCTGEELGLRRELWQKIYSAVEERVKLPIDDGRGDEWVSFEILYKIYNRIFLPITGLDVGERVSVPEEVGDMVTIPGHTLAQSKNANVRKEVMYLYQHGQDHLRDLPLIAELETAHKRAKEATGSLHNYVDDLTQSPTLPRKSRCHRCPS